MEEQQSRISVESLAYDDEKMEACLAEVGSRIREERIKQELSISKLAELSNLSVSCISKAETEKCRISLKALIKIATALKVPVRQFLDIDGIDLADVSETCNREGASVTNGKRFEQIMEIAGEETVTLILDMADELMRAINKESKER
ncbi:MAG: helix-turn-helix transcriptional regulator [Roseburia sp.]|nr:helix-turn-helix transcriptional regulator [Roseburia sp.]